MWRRAVLLVFTLYLVQGKIDSDEEFRNSDRDLDDSSERIGAAVTQIYNHPYIASLLKNDSYVCSAVVLNTYWLLTVSKCFDSDVISSYVNYKHLGNFTVRAGSSYNSKGGDLHQIKMLINNFDFKVSAMKLKEPLEFGSRIAGVRLPTPEDEVSLGYLAAIVAWTPTGHIRVVNAPIIDPSICEPTTKMLPGNYICTGGVQDPNRHFCRRDNGGAVIQNDTLVAIASYLHTCALYTKTHAFPKVASFSRWLDSVIWDENNRPTTKPPPTTPAPTTPSNATDSPPPSQNPYFVDPRRFMLTLPFDPINVPLLPAEDNSVMPRMSLYESYLQNMARAKTSTTPDPNAVEEDKRDWMQKYGKRVMMRAPQIYGKKYEQQYDYN